jgi:small-conductance mechanosensitive channel
VSNELWGNPLHTWLIAVGIFMGVMIVANALRAIIAHALRRERDEGTLSGVRRLIRSLARSSWLLTAMIAWLLAYIPVTVTPFGERVVRQVAVLFLLLQIAIWGSVAISHWLNTYRAKRLPEDPGAVTVASALAIGGRAVLFSVVLILVLENFGVELKALIAGVGVAGIVIGIAAQAVLGDVFASVAIIFDKPFVIGDFLSVGTFNGTVESIGLKTTRLRSLSGEQVVFSNSKLLEQAVRNYQNMEERRIFFRFGVEYGTRYDKLQAIPTMVEEIVSAVPQARFDRAHFVSYGDSSLDFEVAYYVLIPDYVEYLNIQQTVNLALYERFEEEGIAFAYPTRTIHIASSG